ncbi:hypothetical protein D8S78_23175 [Natrialba swarupiae]|nr:hypothetical protein [Natrialba swarupiae]
MIGATVPSLGTDDFGPYISQISNSDADVLAIPLTGGDLIDFIGQADSAGLKDDVDIIGTANFARVVRNALGPAVADTYSAALYDADLEVGDNEQFVSHYEDARRTARRVLSSRIRSGPNDCPRYSGSRDVEPQRGQRRSPRCGDGDDPRNDSLPRLRSPVGKPRVAVGNRSSGRGRRDDRTQHPERNSA